MPPDTVLSPADAREDRACDGAREASDAPELAAEVRVVEHLARIAPALTTELDRARLVQRITDEAKALVGAQFGAFFENSVNESGEHYMLYTLSGVDRSAFAGFSMPRKTAIFAPTFDGEGVVRCDDVTKDPRYGKSAPHYGMPPGHLPVRSYLAAPVKTVGGAVLGGLFFGHAEPGVFTAREERALAALAGIAASALGNADLFEQLRASQEALRESEVRHRLVAESSQDGLWFWDIRTNAVEWNERLLEMTGMKRGAWGGSFDAWLERLHPDDRPRMRAALDAHLTRREPYRVDAFRRLDASGRYRWYRTTGQAEWDEAGDPVKMAGAVSDITDRKLAEEERERDEEGRRLLADATAILGRSIDYETTLANVARAAVPGFADWCAVDIVEGGALRRLAVAHVDPAKVALAEDVARRWPASLDDPHGVPGVIRTGRPEVIEEIPDELLTERVTDPELLRILRDLGLRSSMVVPLVAHGEVFGAITLINAESRRRYRPADVAIGEELGRRAGVAVDNARLYSEAQAAVKERDRALAELRELASTLERRVDERTSELREVNRELESFSYTVSHDLRAPVRHIAGFVDLLRGAAGDELDDRARRYLDTIGAAASQMGSLIDGLLAFSRLGRAEIGKRRVDLAETVRSILSELEPEVSGREIAWSVGDLPVVAADPTMIRLVVSNFVNNAVKYTRGREAAAIEIGSKRVDGHDVVWVKDDGVGFNMSYAHKLFGVFQRLHAPDQFEGTGIGLATARRVVLRHGGRVWAEGAEGRGATFYFSLPSPNEEQEPR